MGPLNCRTEEEKGANEKKDKDQEEKEKGSTSRGWREGDGSVCGGIEEGQLVKGGIEQLSRDNCHLETTLQFLHIALGSWRKRILPGGCINW